MTQTGGAGNGAMQRIPIEKAAPGMKLAKPVTNAAGAVVLAAGVELGQALLERLQRMGQLAIYVEGHPFEDGVAAKTLAELEGELDNRFRKVAGDPLQARIREAVRRHVRASHGIEAASGHRTMTKGHDA